MIIQISLIIIILLYVLFKVFHKFYFLRDPARRIPYGPDIVSPADGKVIRILETDKSEIKVKKSIGKIKTLTKDIGEKCYVVSIFMSPFNVHINRSPIEGKIVCVSHKKGKFFNAADLDKSLLNEKNEILIKNNKIKIKVIQIAGFLARRIECFVKANEQVVKGERIGLINLGSQVTLILPKRCRLKIRKNQIVKAGTTVIADY